MSSLQEIFVIFVSCLLEQRNPRSGHTRRKAQFLQKVMPRRVDAKKEVDAAFAKNAANKAPL